ncbi:MAG: hypothetical protein SFU56_08075 [Capsulimonadales bacterium]|nr:hypothetical protein [Capsulimonadales bacterium]
MAIQTLEERVAQLESRIKEMEERMTIQSAIKPEKRGWRAIVGIDANNPYFEEAVRLGREWRFADSPKDETENE